MTKGMSVRKPCQPDAVFVTSTAASLIAVGRPVCKKSTARTCVACNVSDAHVCMQRIDTLLEAVEVEEVAFQAGCQAAELRAVLATALAQPQRKLSNMHSRIHKHLGATAPKLAAEVPVRLFPFLAGGQSHAHLVEKAAL